MTRKYKLERLQKNILLGISGMTLASTLVFAGAQATNSVSNNPRNAAKVGQTVKSLNKADREKITLCKKDAIKVRQDSKLEANKKYDEAFKALKQKRLDDLKAIKTATTTATTTKAVNKERQTKRFAIEKQFQADSKILKEKRHAERVKADEVYEKVVCKATDTTKPTNQN